MRRAKVWEGGGETGEQKDESKLRKRSLKAKSHNQRQEERIPDDECSCAKHMAAYKNARTRSDGRELEE